LSKSGFRRVTVSQVSSRSTSSGRWQIKQGTPDSALTKKREQQPGPDMSDTMARSFLGALALNNLLHGPVDRAKILADLATTPDRRPELSAEVLESHRLGTTSFSRAEPLGRFTYSINGELLCAPDSVLDSIRTARSVRLRIDSPGGDCIIAQRILEAVDGKPCEVIVTSASSAAALLAACSPGRRTIARDGSLMFHSVNGVCFGSAATMRAYANWIEQCTDYWVERMTARTEVPPETSRAWLTGFEDIRINSEQAMALGLVDAIE
jgi:ATP-dependent protease ClpP protease subunit